MVVCHSNFQIQKNFQSYQLISVNMSSQFSFRDSNTGKGRKYFLCIFYEKEGCASKILLNSII